MTRTDQQPRRLRIGILGCANIAKQFVRDVALSQAVTVVAVASRRAEKAAQFTQTFGIARSYGSYESLLADPDIDAVYIPLPNSLHAQWAIKAAQAKKHILCEKPLSLGLYQANSMFDVARKHHVMLLEAYPYYFQPQTGSMLRLLREGAIGDVRSVQASFGFTLANPSGNIRMDPELGGGALLDAGSYVVSLIRLVMGCAPESVLTSVSWAESGVDISAMATLFFADGRRAQLSCAMDSANHRRATIVGSGGIIETEYLNHTAQVAGDNPYGYLPSQLRIRLGTANSVAFDDISDAAGSGFRFAAEAFCKVIADRDFAAIERAAKASLDIAATMDALAGSAKTGQRVNVGRSR